MIMINRNEYAKALFSLCEEEGITDAVFEQLGFASEIMKENPEYVKLLDTPTVKACEKAALIDEAFGGFEVYFLNFLKLLCEKREMCALCDCKKEFTRLYFNSRGIVECEAVTAVSMTEKQLASLKDKLEGITKKKVLLKNSVDPGILGGVKVRMEDIQLDGSIKSRLDKLKASLENAIV